MSTYRKEWPCCDSVTETDAWEPESCPFCTASPAAVPDVAPSRKNHVGVGLRWAEAMAKEQIEASKDAAVPDAGCGCVQGQCCPICDPDVPDGALPSLPPRDGDWAGDDWFTADSMRDYARAAVSADRAQQGEPVASIGDDPDFVDLARAYRQAPTGATYRAMCAYIDARAATKAAAPADAPADGLLDLIVAYGAACTCMNETARRDLMTEIKGKLSGAAPASDTGTSLEEKSE